MSYHARTILTAAAWRKRREREAAKILAAPRKAAEPGISNQFLAGYMAHEFLTKGTLLGEKWDPARAEAAPATSCITEPNKKKCVEAEPSGKGKRESYAEVAELLKGDGAHVEGVVNPTQLARWIQM